jgi:hypothetical protein
MLAYKVAVVSVFSAVSVVDLVLCLHLLAFHLYLYTRSLTTYKYIKSKSVTRRVEAVPKQQGSPNTPHALDVTSIAALQREYEEGGSRLSSS